jgi:hypothetical protein
MTFPVLVVAAWLSATGVESAAAAVEPAPRTLNVFVAPLPTVLIGALGSVLYSGVVLYLPTGFTVAVGPNWGITGELAGLLVLSREGGYGVSASVGPTWLPMGRGVDGFFVTPKLTFDLSRTPHYGCALGCPDGAGGNNGPIDLGPNVSRSFLAGVDAGYQFSTRVSLALVIGASAGYGYDNGVGSPFVSPLNSTSASAARSQGFTWALNLSLLRIGLGR